MIIKTVTRYFADCGKEYKTKNSALYHDSYCKCWTNPKYKTCLSCKHKNFIKDSDDYRTWKVNDCKNPDFNFDEMFVPAHENADHICINCPAWESKA